MFVSRSVEIRQASTFRNKISISPSITVLISSAEPQGQRQTITPGSHDVTIAGRDAPVPSGGTENTTTHLAALLRLQSHLGLDHTLSDVLHGHHGAVQRGLQK